MARIAFLIFNIRLSQMLNFFAIIAMLIAMFFSYGQGFDDGERVNHQLGASGAAIFGSLAMLFILVR